MERSVLNTIVGRREALAAVLPPGYEVPERFMELTAGEYPDIEPWMWLLEVKGIAEFWSRVLGEQFPDRVLVPFAKHEGSDDVFCFDGTDTSGDPPVLIIHGYTTPGWEYRGQWASFADWYHDALQQHEDWLREEAEYEAGDE